MPHFVCIVFKQFVVFPGWQINNNNNNLFLKLIIITIAIINNKPKILKCLIFVSDKKHYFSPFLRFQTHKSLVIRQAYPSFQCPRRNLHGSFHWSIKIVSSFHLSKKIHTQLPYIFIFLVFSLNTRGPGLKYQTNPEKD